MPVNAGMKRPLNTQPPQQLAIQQPILQPGQPVVYAMPLEGQETVPIVCSPPDNTVPVAPTSEDPIINSPATGPMNFSQADFNNYLNDIDDSINNCRGMIGDRWNDLDLDDFLAGYEDEGSALSPQNANVQQPSTANHRTGNVGFVRPKNSAPYPQQN